MNHHHQLSATTYAGVPLGDARRALILIHGRGADAADILSLAGYLQTTGMALIAPQADQYAWYPFSFLAPTERNEPGLSSALDLLQQLTEQCQEAGIPAQEIFYAGFSQGACLTLEYTARHAQRYGGVFALSGGLIGDQLVAERYSGDFAGTPVFLGCSDVDPHIPLARVNDSATLLTQLGARVNKQIYPGMPHTVIQEELDYINQVLEHGDFL